MTEQNDRMQALEVGECGYEEAQDDVRDILDTH